MHAALGSGNLLIFCGPYSMSLPNLDFGMVDNFQ